MRIKIKKIYKSIHTIQDIDIPDFMVLTGKNGSGKSHLMEAMTNQEICTILNSEGKQLTQIKYIPFNGLNPHIDENCEYLGLTNVRKQAWNAVKIFCLNMKESMRVESTHPLINLLFQTMGGRNWSGSLVRLLIGIQGS